MDIKGLKDAIEKSDKSAKEIGLPQAERFSFVIVTPKPPTGYKARTAFGLCEILNCQQVDGGIQTVFSATRKQVLNLIKKLEAQ
jgi:hypothetical protein